MKRFGLLTIAGLSVAATLGAASVYGQGSAPAAQEPGQVVDPKVKRLFATSCGWCHQGGGRVAGRGPKLAGTDKSDEVIIRQIKQGKPPGMPAFGRSFNDEQIRAIVAYIRSLPDTP